MLTLALRRHFYLIDVRFGPSNVVDCDFEDVRDFSEHVHLLDESLRVGHRAKAHLQVRRYRARRLSDDRRCLPLIQDTRRLSVARLRIPLGVEMGRS